MLAGTIISAILGGLAGLTYGLSNDHSLMQTLIDYQVGGLIAVLAFVSMALPARRQRH